jgi:glycerophosphoryl diester phosphodiesterase
MLIGISLLLMGKPLIIAHRGASGERPEHTLAAYELAIDQGADYIEPDLVITKDGVLVARHENEISGTTDVQTKPEFAARKVEKVVDGQRQAGWFTEDFTLKELRTLRATERLSKVRPANVAFNGKFGIPTLTQILDLVRRKEKQTGRKIGVYPETKHPSYHRSLGLPLEEPLLKVLAKYGYKSSTDPVFIQSFEVGNLKWLRPRTKLNLVQLIDDTGSPADTSTPYSEMVQPDGLRQIAEYANGIGPSKSLVIPVLAGGRLGTPTSLVSNAHAVGLQVHIWTIRREDAFLPTTLRGKPDRELVAFIESGVDGVFTDQPGAAVQVRDSKKRTP